MKALVTTDWLNLHLTDPDLVVLDCNVVQENADRGDFTNSSGQVEYERGHIPTAGFADLTTNLSDGDSPIEFAIPTPQQFCSAMGALGVGDDSLVVLYDDNASGWAARVWSMLRWAGFDNAVLLDGGFSSWVNEGRPLSVETSVRQPKTLTPNPRPELIADKEEVFSSIGDPSVRLVDSMPQEFYRGEYTIYARPGHIPGATNWSVFELLDENGRYRPLHELAAAFDEDKDTRIITYCGGGIVASSTAFILTALGYANVAVYTASLQEWAADPLYPLVVQIA